MSDKEKKSGGSRTLQLRQTVEKSKVQQSLARGKSKTIMVEVKKTRSTSRGTRSTETSTKELSPETETTTDGLTKSEQEKRLKALNAASSPRSKPKFDPVIQERKAKTKPEPKEAEPETAAKEAEVKAPDEPQLPPQEVKEAGKHGHKKPKSESTENEKAKKAVSHKPKSSYENRQRGKLTIANAMEQEERIRSLASIQRAREKAKRKNIDDSGVSEAKSREVTLPEVIEVQELANRMAVRMQDVVKELMKLGIMSVTAPIDADTAELIISEFGHTAKRVTAADVEDILTDEEVNEEDLEARPPVVTIMGHVDHGKTSLLDVIRKSSVTDGEAGGITQHIGAYQINTESGHKVTFLDTPGHAAFTAMRKRGANVTDIVVLVVAADDGIMPQTIEAINHAKAAEVPIIVAINKMDKPEADPTRVKTELLTHELITEDMGGEIQAIEVSATTKMGIDKLIEAIELQAEILELKASKKVRAHGTVIEARMDKGRGIVATLLVENGLLQKGDLVLAGVGFGKSKLLIDDQGKQLKEAGPATPVEILGLGDLPQAGDTFNVVEEEKQARDIIEYREKRDKDLKMANSAKDGASIEDIFTQANADTKELNLIIKGDVQGSVEAIIGSVEKIANDEVKIKFMHSAAGGITESDVQLASTTGAFILAFNVRADAKVRELADTEKVDIRYYSVIYDLIDDMKAVAGGLMSPVIREKFIGNAKILEVFKITKSGKVAGCMVTEGTIKRGAGVRLVRDNVVIHEGTLKTLKRFKDEVPEVKQGTECGMAFANYENIEPGDEIEAFELIEEQQVIE